MNQYHLLIATLAEDVTILHEFCVGESNTTSKVLRELGEGVYFFCSNQPAAMRDKLKADLKLAGRLDVCQLQPSYV
jgi:hypothetical protein